MEYLDSSLLDCVFNFLLNKDDPKINRERLLESIKGILSRLRELEIVHGYFRSNNIMAKRSADDPTILEDFMLVDFEFSGKVNESYTTTTTITCLCK
jgi:tRNA A-37 threonylcarbamoyl transferase component Bud32